jgi:hypothetical protein
MTCPDCNTTHVTNRDARGQPMYQLCPAVVQRRVPEAAETRAERAAQRLVRRRASGDSPGFSVTNLVRRGVQRGVSTNPQSLRRPRRR